MMREGFIRQYHDGEKRHSPRRNVEPPALAPTKEQRDAEMARLLNEAELKRQQGKAADQQGTPGEREDIEKSGE